MTKRETGVYLYPNAGEVDPPRMSRDRVLQALLYLTILLFVSAGVLPLARSRYPFAKWARWGAIAVFGAAVVYALAMTLGWVLSRTS